MPERGYVYLLINRSMPGLIKVGRTSRPMEHRVSELSAPTGVPTPFELVYEVLVDDCAAAEALIHNQLTQRGYRVSANREFFQAPIREVLGLMMALPRSDVDGGENAGVSLSTGDRIRPDRRVVLRDPLFRAAAELAVRQGQLAVYEVQRAFGIGFSRATSIVDELVWAHVLERGEALGAHRTLISADRLADIQ